MSNSEQLLQQIDDIVASKTFGLDALEGIKKIKDSLKATLLERDALQKKYDGLNETNTRQSEEIRRQSGVIAGLEKQLADSKALNDAGQKAIYDAEKHKAVADAWQGALQTVFKPNTVRETVYESIPISQNYNGNPMVSSYHQETKTTREEL